MAEPTSTAIAGGAIGGGAIIITGGIMGVHYDAMIAGFFGGLVALSFLPAGNLLRSAVSAASACLIAGFFSPVAATAAVNYFGWLAPLGDNLRAIGGFAIGLSAQAIIPIALKWARAKGGLE